MNEASITPIANLMPKPAPPLNQQKHLVFSTFPQFAVEAFLQRVDRMQPVVSFVHPHYLVFETTEN